MEDIKKTFSDGYSNSNVEEIREQKKQARKEQDKEPEKQEVELEKASPYMLMKLGLEKLNKKNEDTEE